MFNIRRVSNDTLQIYSKDNTVPVMVDMTELGYPGVIVQTTIATLTEARANIKKTMIHEKLNALQSLQAACESAYKNIVSIHREKG